LSDEETPLGRAARVAFEALEAELEVLGLDDMFVAVIALGANGATPNAHVGSVYNGPAELDAKTADGLAFDLLLNATRTYAEGTGVTFVILNEGTSN
jgi:hypothetical protein